MFCFLPPPAPLLTAFPLVHFLGSISWVRKKVHEFRTGESPDVSKGGEGETGMSHRPGFPRTSHLKTGTAPTHSAGTSTWESKCKAISVEKWYLFKLEILEEQQQPSSTENSYDHPTEGPTPAGQPSRTQTQHALWEAEMGSYCLLWPAPPPYLVCPHHDLFNQFPPLACLNHFHFWLVKKYYSI